MFLVTLFVFVLQTRCLYRIDVEMLQNMLRVVTESKGRLLYHIFHEIHNVRFYGLI